MKQNGVLTLLILIGLLVGFVTSWAGPESEVEFLPDITLTVPANRDFIKYLGLKGEPGTEFSLSDVDADILVIEMFSMYCPHCQKSAPAVNELYQKMEQMTRPDLKLVIIGIGASNTGFEVDTFRDGFDVAFPLFPDPDLEITRALSVTGTPTFIVKKKDGEKNIIFFRKTGGFTDSARFLDDLLNLSGLKTKEVKHDR